MAKQEATDLAPTESDPALKPVHTEDGGGDGSGGNATKTLEEGSGEAVGLDEVDLDVLPAAKRRKAEDEMTVEEYEAMLDAEDQAGGFFDAVDIMGAVRQDG